MKSQKEKEMRRRQIKQSVENHIPSSPRETIYEIRIQ